MLSDSGLQGSKVMRQSRVETLVTEEPDDRIGHVRICGGAGRETGWSYPEADSDDTDYTPAHPPNRCRPSR